MNAILSLILSLVMAFSGAAALPETATTWTLSNIVLEINGETVALNPSASLTLAPGGEQLQAGLDVFLEDEAQISLDGELSTDGLRFSLSDYSSVYALSGETLDALTGLSLSEAELAPVTEIISDYFALIATAGELMQDTNAAIASSEKMMEFWTERSGAVPEESRRTIDGETITVKTVELNLSVMDVYAALDWMLEDDSLQGDYVRQMLDLFNKAFGGSYIGFVDLITAMFTSIPDEEEAAQALAILEEMHIPMTVTYGGNDIIYIAEGECITEIEGIAMEIYSESMYIGDMIQAQMQMTMGDEALQMGMDMNGIFNAEGRSSFNVGLSAGDGNENAMSMVFSIDTGDNGLGNDATFASLDLIIAEEQMTITDEDVLYETVESGFTLSVSSGERPQEDGSITTDYAIDLTTSGLEEDIAASLSFEIKRSEAPFVDAFEGREVVNLPADTGDEAYSNLSVELLAPVSGLMALGMDESVQEAAALLADVSIGDAASIGVIGGADGPTSIFVSDDGNEDYLYIEYPEYSYSVYDGVSLDLEAAAEAFGGALPAYTAPEGFELTSLYTSDGYASFDYESGDQYFNLTMYTSYGMQEEAMVLNGDGSFAPLEGDLVRMSLNDDGTVFSADLNTPDVQYTFYVSSMKMEQVQEIICGLL